jgi:hypothetical protein
MSITSERRRRCAIPVRKRHFSSHGPVQAADQKIDFPDCRVKLRIRGRALHVVLTQSAAKFPRVCARDSVLSRSPAVAGSRAVGGPVAR